MFVKQAQYITGVTPKHRHFHDSHQILFVTDGIGKLKINDSFADLKKGSIAIVGRFEKHSIIPESENFCRFAVRISAQDAKDKLYSVFYNRPSGFSHVLDMQNDFDTVCDIFKTIAFEKQNDFYFKEDMLKLFVDRLLITIYRQYPQVFSVTEDQCFEKISALQRLFEQNYYRNFTLETLARQNNMSVSYLSHSFKKITGSSVMGYLLQCRLTASKNLLTHSNDSIGEIVDKCGFSDVSNFARTFKANTGLSPTDFRKKYS